MSPRIVTSPTVVASILKQKARIASNNASVSTTKVNTPKKMDGMQVAIVSERKRRQELERIVSERKRRQEVERRTQKNKRMTAGRHHEKNPTKKMKAVDAPKVTWEDEVTTSSPKSQENIEDDNQVEVSGIQTQKENDDTQKHWFLALLAGDEEDRKTEDWASTVVSEFEDDYDDDDDHDHDENFLYAGE